MAGLNGPDLNEFDQLYPPADVAPPRRGADGDVRAATGGNKDLFPGVSEDGLPKDCSNGFGSREKWLLPCGPEK